MERQAVAIAALEFHGEEPKVQELERRIQKLEPFVIEKPK